MLFDIRVHQKLFRDVFSDSVSNVEAEHVQRNVEPFFIIFRLYKCCVVDAESNDSDDHNVEVYDSSVDVAGLLQNLNLGNVIF